MADKAWKRWEREVAADFGGKRTGPTGQGLPDVSGTPIAFECKYRGKFSIKRTDVEQAIRNAKNRPWAVCLRIKRSRLKYVVLPYDLFYEMYHNFYGGKKGTE